MLNPFRYRGYYYDTETELYFLQTRYYDPEVGRFISQDSIDYADPETINGLNLYAYCGNNPVMYSDPNGTTKWWQWLLLGVAVVIAAGIVATVATGGTALIAAGIAIGGAVAGLTSVVGQGVTKGWDNIDVGQIGADMLFGSALGGLGAAGGIGAGFGSAAGSLAIAGGGTVSVGTAVADVGALSIGLGILFAKGVGPRMGHHEYENKMWNEAMKILEINDKDLRQWLHHKNRKMPYAETLNKLLDNLKKILSRRGNR